VLALRAQIYLKLEKWELLQVVAKQLALADPDNPQWHLLWASATRRVDCLESARLILITAVESHSLDPVMHYNLACRECLLGDMAVALGAVPVIGRSPVAIAIVAGMTVAVPVRGCLVAAGPFGRLHTVGETSLSHL
jgi:hypothetical protein